MSDKSTFKRLCGCSFIYPGRSLHEGLEIVKRFGFTHVDIGVGGGNAHFDPVQVAENPVQFADDVRREMEHFSLIPNECFTLNFGTPINTPNLEERRNTQHLFTGLCRFAKLAQYKSILLIPGPIYPELGARGSLDLAFDAFGKLVTIANEHDVQLNIEADCESCANTPEAAKELCERVPNLGLTLDHSHFICQGIEVERIEVLYPFARHVHVRQSAPKQIVAAVAEGVVDFSKVVGKLNQVGYDGFFCIEYLALSSDENASREAEAGTLAMKEVMRAILGEAR